MHTIKSFKKLKKQNQKITMLTAYDFYSAKMCEQAGVDTILVGDSLAMVMLGYENTLKVKLEDMLLLSAAVKRGAKNTFIIADMPYKSYHINTEQSKINAFKFIQEADINAVKLEGASPSRIEVIKAIVDCEIPVCGHLGLTPQSIQKFGGFKIQGKTQKSYQNIIDQAIKIEDAGAFMIVLEGIPEELGKVISEKLKIPTIGIGAGRYCDGQVLVWHDLLGISGSEYKFANSYLDLNNTVTNAIKKYCNDIKQQKFPEINNVYFPIENKE